jgi:hypothetical protein
MIFDGILGGSENLGKYNIIKRLNKHYLFFSERGCEVDG